MEIHVKPLNDNTPYKKGVESIDLINGTDLDVLLLETETNDAISVMFIVETIDGKNTMIEINKNDMYLLMSKFKGAAEKFRDNRKKEKTKHL